MAGHVSRILGEDQDEFVGNSAYNLRRYALQLSEVVIQQHEARYEDWAQWRARESELLEEVRALQQQVQTLAQEQDGQAVLDQELRAERRRRIDAEARLTGAEVWRTEAAAADRAARAASSHSISVQGAESNEAREWKRQATMARSAEASAIASEKRAEDTAYRAQQELARHLREAEGRVTQSERRAQASEAMALGEAWEITGELRSELDACCRGANRWGAGSPPRPDGQFTTARHALQELRGVRERYNQLLAELPN
mmetsp:Transcript_44839/g.90421  ORF Transcript_44839/g.90421 Transcript_44839/m.90421 type:complete len:257 (-) Transcript_44839:115-885(-)|eukprot:CAMPEP_0113821470 /NCGR_PEP_ID=MMETSP0328-20130328/1754_1 /TAXON_ID=39455 /ORGANISM="Alexandrium minutum" /LENGTH=256 /DNA_ID=CAMNT_0000789401 /DNA_START=102 /DNA_END=872 /DNA_ORIENTATION=+ /assembly_acc=CAM_ASM_000350